MNKVLISLLVFFTSLLPLYGDIVEIDDITRLSGALEENTLVLFNIAEVCMDTDRSLGSQAWRQYVRSRVSKEVHDALTLLVFKNVPPKAVENVTAPLIKDLQESGYATLAFTSRGRNEWYSTEIEGIDTLTEQLLSQIGIDFSQTQLPEELATMDQQFADYYHAGIIYTTNSVDKGPLLEQILDTTGYLPSRIIFIDDKAKSLESVEKAMDARGIPFSGFAYKRTAKDHADFDIMVAHVQLDFLINRQVLLTDQTAQQLIRMSPVQNRDPEAYFQRIIQKWESKNK